jgi:hypothetical protein
MHRAKNATKHDNLLLSQVASLKQLEYENQEAAKQLELVVEQGEALLSRIQEALHDIAQSQLHSQMLETSVARAPAYATSADHIAATGSTEW